MGSTVIRALALLGVIAAPLSIRAQSVVQARLEQLAQQKVAGAAPVTDPFGGLLNKKQATAQQVELVGGRCYTLIGTGGDGVKDVDIYFYDAANKKVASDLGFDAAPALSYCPPWPGQHRVELVVKDGSGEVAAQLFVQPLPAAAVLAPPPPPRAAPDDLTRVIEAAADAQAQKAARMTEFFRGAGKEGEHGDYTVALEPARCYSLFGSASPTVRALSIYLWDPSGKRAAEHKPNANTPALHYCPHVGGPFHVQAKVAGGVGEFRLAVYAHPPQTQPKELARRPAAGPRGGDPVTALLEAQAKQVAPGYKRVGEVFRGAGGRNSRSDWTVPLEGGKCYTFVGVGGVGVEQLSLYAWDPTGKRVADRRSENSQSVMGLCPTMPGPYHLQAKIEKGSGDYRMATYVK
jgi:hypothetical protein